MTIRAAIVWDLGINLRLLVGTSKLQNNEFNRPLLLKVVLPCIILLFKTSKSLFCLFRLTKAHWNCFWQFQNKKQKKDKN